MHQAIALMETKDVSPPNYELEIKDVRYFNTWKRTIRSDLRLENGIDSLQNVSLYRKDGNIWKKIDTKLDVKSQEGYFEKNVITWKSKFQEKEQQLFRFVFVRTKPALPCLLTGSYCSKKIKISLDNVFVAYAFHSKFLKRHKLIQHLREILENCNLKPLFWEAKTERGHFDCKICRDIQESLFIILEFSDANPNVAFEFGLGIAMGKDYFILRKEGSYDLPADIQGLDSIQYKNYSDLRKKLSGRIKDRYTKLLNL